MKNKIIYILLGAAAIVILAVFYFNFFYMDATLNDSIKLSAAKSGQSVKFIQPDVKNSRKNSTAASGIIINPKDNLFAPGGKKPGQSDPETQPRIKTNENEAEFEIDPGLLKELFPDNLARPSVTDEDRKAKIKAREARNTAYGLIAANKATEEQIHAYYEQQTRLAEDSIEIIEFILDTYRDQLGERERAKQEFLLMQFQKRLEIIPQKEQEALQRLMAKQDAGNTGKD